MRIFALVFAALMFAGAAVAGEKQKTRIGDWVAECQVDKFTDERKCLVYAHLNQTRRKPNAFYVLNLNPEGVAIVGEPLIAGSRLRIDKHQMHECTGVICAFDDDASAKILTDIAQAESILIQVVSLRANNEFTLSGADYRKALAQIDAWSR